MALLQAQLPASFAITDKVLVARLLPQLMAMLPDQSIQVVLAPVSLSAASPHPLLTQHQKLGSIDRRSRQLMNQNGEENVY